MQDVRSFDFIVVGAGMAGASAAASLAQSGRVAVLEGEQHAGYHSTGRSAALFSEIYGNEVIRALTRASRGDLFDPPSSFASISLASPRGALYFARPDQLDVLDQFVENKDVRHATRRMSPHEICARVSIFRNDYLGGGVLDIGAADLDVDAIHQGFLRLARQRGSEVLFDTTVRTMRRESGYWLVTTERECLRAPVVVNAAGAWGDELATLAGVTPVGLQPMRRTAMLIPLPETLSFGDWPAAVDISEQFYFKPDAGLLLLSPADEHPSVPCDAQPDELDVATAVDHFERATNIQVRQVRRRWAGLRVFAPDRSPVVGFDPEVEGFFWLVGQGGYGIQTAPALARVAAALASERSIPSDIADQGVTAAQLSKARLVDATTVARTLKRPAPEL